jgi:cytochrome c-type biogenesis protein
MARLLEAFLLGNSALLSNVCLLPLYPGLIAFLVGNAENERARDVAGWLGFIVLAGVLSMMLLVGFILFSLQRSFASLLPWLLPIIYGSVIVLGIFLLSGRNPFMRLAGLQSPVLNNPFFTAFLYGLLLGPMTLPCTGPIIVSAFLLGAGDPTNLIGHLLYFLSFGLGFGWPLVLLPLITLPLQQGMTRWLSQHHLLLNRLTGTLLIAIGVFGIGTEILPQLRTLFA